MRLLCLMLVLAGCGSTSVVTPPNDENVTTPTDVAEADKDEMTSTSTTLGAEDKMGAEDAPVRPDPTATTSVVPSSSGSEGDSESNDGSTSTGETSSTTTAPQVMNDPDTVEPQEPELFTEEPSDNSGLFGTEEPGSSA